MTSEPDFSELHHEVEEFLTTNAVDTTISFSKHSMELLNDVLRLAGAVAMIRLTESPQQHELGHAVIEKVLRDQTEQGCAPCLFLFIDAHLALLEDWEANQTEGNTD